MFGPEGLLKRIVDYFMCLHLRNQTGLESAAHTTNVIIEWWQFVPRSNVSKKNTERCRLNITESPDTSKCDRYAHKSGA